MNVLYMMYKVLVETLMYCSNYIHYDSVSLLQLLAAHYLMFQDCCSETFHSPIVNYKPKTTVHSVDTETRSEFIKRR